MNKQGLSRGDLRRLAKHRSKARREARTLLNDLVADVIKEGRPLTPPSLANLEMYAEMTGDPGALKKALHKLGHLARVDAVAAPSRLEVSPA